MPVYLLHGFRWPRPLIRIHIILQDLDDAAAEWLIAPGTTATMLNNFKELFPDAMKYLDRLRFIEQYDPNDESSNSLSQPYAYVADIVEEVKLGVDVDDIRGRGVGSDQWGALMELRDKLAPEEKVGWYVVVCGDTERLAPTPPGAVQSAQESNAMHRDSETETEDTYKKNHGVGCTTIDLQSLSIDTSTEKDISEFGRAWPLQKAVRICRAHGKAQEVRLPHLHTFTSSDM